MQRTKSLTLYNMIFPIWLLWLLPPVSLLILPANFLWDMLILVLSMRALGITGALKKARSVIVRVWLCGFLADAVGALAMVFMSFIQPTRASVWADWWYDKVMGPSVYNPLSNPYAFGYVGIFILLSAILIYICNIMFCLNKLTLEMQKKKKLALFLAVFTAPYLFYLPVEWFA